MRQKIQAGDLGGLRPDARGSRGEHCSPDCLRRSVDTWQRSHRQDSPLQRNLWGIPPTSVIQGVAPCLGDDTPHRLRLDEERAQLLGEGETELLALRLIEAVARLGASVPHGEGRRVVAVELAEEFQQGSQLVAREGRGTAQVVLGDPSQEEPLKRLDQVKKFLQDPYPFSVLSAKSRKAEIAFLKQWLVNDPGDFRGTEKR